MIKQMSSLVYIFYILLFPLNLSAQEAENEVEEILVTAERIDEEESKDQTAFVTVIEADEFSERATSVPELLDQSAGINIKQYGGLGSFSTISIRGSSAEQVAIFMDGVLLNQAHSGVVNLADIPLDNIERIEVYRGTSPAKFGSSGIGGVVNIITRRFKDSSYYNLKYTYGSFDTNKADVLLSKNWEKLRSMMIFNYTGSKGDFEFYDDNGTPDNPDDDTKTRRKNNDFDSYNILTKAGYELAPGFEIDLSNNFFLKDQGIPGISNNQSQTANLKTLRNISHFKLTKQGLLEKPLDIELLLSFSFQRQKFQDKEGDIGIGRQDNKEDTYLYAGHILLSYHPQNWQIINLLFQIKREEFKSINYLSGSSDSRLQNNTQNEPLLQWADFWLDWFIHGKEGGNDDIPVKETSKRTRKSADNQSLPRQYRTTYTTTLEDEMTFFDNRVILTPSIRHEYYRNDFTGKDTFLPSPEGSKDNSEGLTSGKLGAKINLTDYFYIKGNAGKYYRIPNFSELFGDRGYIVGNSNLKPEKGVNWDIGFSFRLHNRWYLKKFNFEYAYFKSSIDDLIILVQNSQRTSIAMNIAEAEIKGHELSWFMNWGNRINITGNYTIQDATDRGDIPYWRNKKLPNRPGYELFNRVQLYNHYGRIYHEYTLMGDNYRDRANQSKIGKREIHNLGISLFLPRRITLTFEVKNIFNKLFEDVLGYPLPGRSYFTTISWNI